MFSQRRYLIAGWSGIIGSAVLSGKLSILENLLHLVNLFYTSNLKAWFAL
jgi:hypothetical protein